MNNQLICLLISPSYTIMVRGRAYRFEMHHYCGPTLLRKDGEMSNRIPGENHPFWWAVTCWDRQGQRTGGELPNGEKLAVWKYVRPRKKDGLTLYPMPSRKK